MNTYKRSKFKFKTVEWMSLSAINQYAVWINNLHASKTAGTKQMALWCWSLNLNFWLFFLQIHCNLQSITANVTMKNNCLHCSILLLQRHSGLCNRQNLIVSAHTVVIIRASFRKIISFERNQEYFCSKVWLACILTTCFISKQHNSTDPYERITRVSHSLAGKTPSGSMS